MEIYGDDTFRKGIATYLDLRDHFNNPQNLFAVPHSVNEEKQQITRTYINAIYRNSSSSPKRRAKGGAEKRPFAPTSPLLIVYVREALPIVKAHIASLRTVSEELKEELLEYAEWLGSL